LAHLQNTVAASGLHVEEWGTGAPVVLVHGSLATGADEWDAQRPLATEGFRLLVLDRRGYGQSPVATGEDYVVDADDIVDLMGDGAHLVGHSYGGLGVMVAAARRPDATKSLTLLEAPVPMSADADPAWQALVDEVGLLWGQNLSDEDWVIRFLKAVGSDPDQFPPELLAAAVPLVPVLRRGRPFYQGGLPLAELAAARFPKLVVSGGHHAGFERSCADLAQRIGAAHEVIEGAGHEIQFTGDPINQALLTLWRSTGEISDLRFQSTQSVERAGAR
jgi:pimeloyl-ACP methyl ester carboxylesterase